MSINALGFATPAASALPALGGPLPIGREAKDPAAEAQARAEAAAARQKADLAEIREKGIYQYAQERKFEALKAKIEKEIMAERGITESSLASMTPEDQDAAKSSLEQEIAKRIQEAMKQAMDGETSQAAAQGRAPQPMIIDISV